MGQYRKVSVLRRTVNAFYEATMREVDRVNQVQSIQRLRAQGQTFGEIAENLGVSRQAIQQFLKHHAQD